MTDLPKNPDPSSLIFKAEIHNSTSATIYVVECNGTRYVLKVFHKEHDPDNPNPNNKPEERRYQNEVKAYQALHKSGACASGFVPKYYGTIADLDPKNHKPWLDHFEDDKLHPEAIMLEFLENAELLSHVNYTEERLDKAADSLEWVHKALVLHQDISESNILIVPGDPERVLMTDFDFADTFDSKEAFEAPIREGWGDMTFGDWEDYLLGELGEYLEQEQKQASA